MAAVALATSPQPRKLRVGLFADSALQPRWAVEAFARVAASDFAEVVVIGTMAQAHRPREPWLLALYGWLDRKVFVAGPDPEERLELARYVPHERSGALDAGPGALLALDLDVAFALGEVDDAKLDGIARYGVWRFYGDGRREVLEGTPQTGSGLTVRLAPGAEARAAYQSWSRTYPLSVARNRSRLLHKTAQFPWRALRELQRSGAAWLEQCKALPAAPARAAGAQALHSYVPSLARRIVRRGVEKSLRVEYWFLAFSFCAQREAIRGDLAGLTRIVPPRDRIWADPFPIERNGRYFVFFEEMTLASGRGHIAMIEIERNGRWTAPVRVLERDHHLSYPFVLEHQGELYMVPETGENRTVELWRCVEFPLRWRLERTLLDGLQMVDATFHRGADGWWMFGNAASSGWSVNDELHLFQADDLLGDWHAHHRNPVKSDARCARPAGRLYWRDGALFRPAQICVPDYGSGLSINRVMRLSSRDYAERQVERILPAANSGLLGIHTINRAGDLTVVDAWARRPRLPFG